MPALAVPLAADRLEAWEAWTAELAGPRKAEFDDLNARHGLTEHRVYLQAMPDGGYLVVVIHEGPGAEDFAANVGASEHEFDRWFAAAVAEVHGLDPAGPLPPAAERRL